MTKIIKKETLVNYWEENIRNNLKVISALIFIIIGKMLGIIFLGIRLGLDPILILIILETTLEPFIIIWLRVIFTGEISMSEVEREIISAQAKFEKDKLNDKLKYEREIAEYRVQLAAKTGSVQDSIIANKDFNEMNKKLGQLENEQVIISKQVASLSELEAHIENLKQLSNTLPEQKKKINGEIKELEKIKKEAEKKEE